MLTLEEIRKLTVAGQSVKGIISSIEATMRTAAISGESSATVAFTRSDMPSAEAWKTCRKILEDRGFVVVEDVSQGAAYSMAIAWSVKSASSPSVGKLHAVPALDKYTLEKAPETKIVKVALPKPDAVMVLARLPHRWRNRPSHLPRFDGVGGAYCNYHQTYHSAAEFASDSTKEGGITTSCMAGQLEAATNRAATTMVPKIADNGDVYCSRCAKYYPKVHFAKETAKKSGYADYCKKCEKEDRAFYLKMLAEKAVASAKAVGIPFEVLNKET